MEVGMALYQRPYAGNVFDWNSIFSPPWISCWSDWERDLWSPAMWASLKAAQPRQPRSTGRNSRTSWGWRPAVGTSWVWARSTSRWWSERIPDHFKYLSVSSVRGWKMTTKKGKDLSSSQECWLAFSKYILDPGVEISTLLIYFLLCIPPSLGQILTSDWHIQHPSIPVSWKFLVQRINPSR